MRKNIFLLQALVSFCLVLCAGTSKMHAANLAYDRSLLGVDVDFGVTKLYKSGFDSTGGKIGERMVGMAFSYTSINDFKRNWLFALGFSFGKSHDSDAFRKAYYDLKAKESSMPVGYQLSTLTELHHLNFVFGKHISLWHSVSRRTYTESDAAVDLMTGKNCTTYGSVRECKSEAIGSPVTTASELSLVISTGYGSGNSYIDGDLRQVAFFNAYRAALKELISKANA